ncbi:hypothetical protein ACFO4O_12340 [Glaciecola siphonariae]|uniref:Secreted protein n=1 Tax=Glaciecola siphonariae TaxID=521012 RepID=A0ABV9LZT0_9ALTE
MHKSKSYLKRMVGTLAVSSVAVVVSVYLMLASANAPCHNTTSSFASTEALSTHALKRGNADVDVMCNRNNQTISWVSWLFKPPESAQFHFVDLLELLNRNP